jgi:DNA-binding transcriptional MerR regulator
MIDDEELLTVDDELVPIREISRLTGVNTVTLRAWERRYGLLIPQRTSKGHRLYSRADIDRVKEIQLWLGRGLAISKVKALFASQSFEQDEQSIDSNWIQLAQQIQAAINNFQRKSLERLIADTLALYPAEMVADYLFSVLMLDLQGDEPGMAARRAFFSSLALEMILEAQARQRQSAAGQQIVLLSATREESPLLAQLFGYSLLINQYQVEYLGCLNLREALLGCQALDAKIVVIIGYGSMNAAELQLHLNGWQEKSATPVVLLGDITIPCRAFDLAQYQGVELCSNQQQAITFINQFLKG